MNMLPPCLLKGAHHHQCMCQPAECMHSNGKWIWIFEKGDIPASYFSFPDKGFQLNNQYFMQSKARFFSGSPGFLWTRIDTAEELEQLESPCFKTCKSSKTVTSFKDARPKSCDNTWCHQELIGQIVWVVSKLLMFILIWTKDPHRGTFFQMGGSTTN